MDSLATWQLHFVEWGYSTTVERAKAAANPRINVLQEPSELVQLGRAQL